MWRLFNRTHHGSCRFLVVYIEERGRESKNNNFNQNIKNHFKYRNGMCELIVYLFESERFHSVLSFSQYMPKDPTNEVSKVRQY